MNAIGLGSVGLGVLTPIFTGDLSTLGLAKIVAGASIAYIFHQLALMILRGLED